MFTGIIEATGEVFSKETNGTNSIFWIKSPISNELKIDQSVSHSGICLTVDKLNDGMHRVTAIEETITKTNVANWEEGTIVNLERCMPMNGRLDGHIVQGHVDATGRCLSKTDKQGSWEFSFSISEEFSALIIEKGSISINGTSLTLFNVKQTEFTVAIIPYTYEHTNIYTVEPGDLVNLEFDIIGKYVNRMHQVNGSFNALPASFH